MANSDASGPALLGRVLDGRYRIDALLARGGMSTVYRGWDLRLQRKVAVKVLSDQFAADPKFLLRFHREALAAAKLDNPHVVGVFDQGRDADNVYLVMELVDGGTARDLLSARRKLPVELALAILEPTLDALADAHRAGLVHRDVKPENILISLRGEIKVADFGLVRAVTSTTMATGDVILGTVAYLSPEQVETGACDTRSDVYAAGVVGYEMLTGKPPFTGDNAISVAYQHVHSQVPSLIGATDLPEPIARVLDAATNRDAQYRPADAGEFLAELRYAREQLKIRLAPIPVVRREPGAPSTHHTPVQPAAAPTRTAQATAPGRNATHGPNRRDAYRSRRITLLRRRRLLVAMVILILAAAAAGTGWWLASEWTSAPDVVGVSAAQALAAVSAAELAPTVVSRYDDHTGAGEVISAEPTADARVRRGATVTLVVSLGKPAVPQIASGSAVTEASEAIRAVSLNPVLPPDGGVYDDQVPVGTVIRTEPGAGEQLSVGADVSLIVSKGPAPQTVPPVAGKRTEDAQNQLLVAGFQPGPVKTRFDASVPAGTVIGTDPPGGSTAPHGSAVSLVLATSLTVPEPTSHDLTAVADQLRGDGFTVRIGQPVFDRDTAAGGLVGMQPQPGARIDPDDPIVTLIGSTAIAVPPAISVPVGQAKKLLADAGLAVQVHSLFGSDTSAVTEQQPRAGTLVAPGSTVQLWAWP